MNKAKVRTNVLGIKSAVVALREAIDALPEGEARANLQALESALHKRFNVAALAVADFFDDEVIREAALRTGGEDKPEV